MSHDQKTIERIVLTRVVRLNPWLLGLVGGLMVGFVVFAATIWLVLKGGEVVGPHLILLSEYFIGYEVTLKGSFVGFVYGLLVGFVAVYLLTRTYNLVADFRVGWHRRK